MKESGYFIPLQRKKTKQNKTKKPKQKTTIKNESPNRDKKRNIEFLHPAERRYF